MFKRLFNLVFELHRAPYHKVTSVSETTAPERITFYLISFLLPNLSEKIPYCMFVDPKDPSDIHFISGYSEIEFKLRLIEILKQKKLEVVLDNFASIDIKTVNTQRLII